VWNFSKKASVTTLKQRVTFKVKIENVISFDQLVGQVMLDLSILANHPTYENWLPITDEKGRTRYFKYGGVIYEIRGEIHIIIHFQEIIKDVKKPSSPSHQTLVMDL
jgi:hypothetical protein